MSLFRTLVDGISSVSNMVTANISPYKVQVVKPESFDSVTVVKRDQFLVLYQKPGCFECVYANLAVCPKYFSVFRLMKDGESQALYKSLSSIIKVLACSSSSLQQEDKIQALCDAIREHPTWNCAHVAAHVGMFEAFKNPEVEKQLNAVCNVSGVSPLMAGVLGRQKHCVHEMLIHKARMNIADQQGLTVYHYAVRYLPDVIDFLVDHDTHKVYDWVDVKGRTPLYTACSQKPEKSADPLQQKHKAVEMLLMGGADAGITKCDRSPIHVAVSHGEKKCIELILMKDGRQKEARDKRYNGTPLHWAQTREVTELLCQLGCDVDSVSNTNHTPLQIMMMNNREDCLMELLCYGADCNIGDMNGDTPLHWAVQRDDIDMMRTFVVFGANVNQKNTQNHSPRHMAAISKGKNRDVILHLLHISGAKRCTATVKGCMPGCSMEGSFNGKPDEKTKPLLLLDKMALFDDMLCTAVSCSSKLDTDSGDAVLDLTDGPSEVGDRVLCLDGGGIRGLVLIQLLAALEEEAGVPVKELFDWIGGTSTGGILALGIGVGKPLAYLKGLYFRLKDEVFNGSRPYDSLPFESFLKREFGEKRVMTDIRYPKIMVTAALADRYPAELHLFRTYQPTLDKPAQNKGKNEQYEALKPPREQLIWKSARSTGAAPTYFRTFGQFMDGGVMANNPTLDILTEIHEYNMGLKFRNETESVQPLGCVVSLGCGRVPVVPRDHIDVFRPSGLFEAHKALKGTTALVSLLIDQASVAEGRPVDRARAWCSMMNVPFYRFSPQLSEDIPLDCKDNRTLITMMWETQCYIVANKHRIQQVAQLLKAGSGHHEGNRQKVNKVTTTSLHDLQLHAASQ